VNARTATVERCPVPRFHLYPPKATKRTRIPDRRDECIEIV
jgi:hypothetical protein